MSFLLIPSRSGPPPPPPVLRTVFHPRTTGMGHPWRLGRLSTRRLRGSVVTRCSSEWVLCIERKMQSDLLHVLQSIESRSSVSEVLLERTDRKRYVCVVRFEDVLSSRPSQVSKRSTNMSKVWCPWSTVELYRGCPCRLFPSVSFRPYPFSGSCIFFTI